MKAKTIFFILLAFVMFAIIGSAGKYYISNMMITSGNSTNIFVSKFVGVDFLQVKILPFRYTLSEYFGCAQSIPPPPKN